MRHGCAQSPRPPQQTFIRQLIVLSVMNTSLQMANAIGAVKCRCFFPELSRQRWDLTFKGARKRLLVGADHTAMHIFMRRQMMCSNATIPDCPAALIASPWADG